MSLLMTTILSTNAIVTQTFYEVVSWTMRCWPIGCGKSRLFWSVVLSLTLFGSSDPAAFAQDRYDFANKLTNVKVGMCASEVETLLGAPEDKRTQLDRGGIRAAHCSEIWRYGLTRNKKVATLGQVYFDHGARVLFVFGASLPTDARQFNEGELRELFEAIGSLKSYGQPDYDPLCMINTVNRLQPLGKARALAAIREFLRVASEWDDEGREGIRLLLRVLFEPPRDTERMPEVLGSLPTMPSQSDASVLPHFPIYLAGDIPFMLSKRFRVAGSIPRVEEEVEVFAAKCALRATKLTPSTQPLREVDAIVDQLNSMFPASNSELHGEVARLGLEEQALRLLRSVVKVDPGPRGSLLMRLSTKDRQAIIATVKGQRYRWSSELGIFIFEDGTWLKDWLDEYDSRVVWRARESDPVIVVVLERRGSRYVDYDVLIEGVVNGAQDGCFVEILSESQNQVLASMSTDFDELWRKRGMTNNQGGSIVLDKEFGVRIRLTMGDVVAVSERLEP